MTYEINVAYRSARCDLIVWEDENTITVSSLWATYRKRGHATGLMGRVVAIADCMDMHMILNVQPYGDNQDRMSHDQLRKFYEGFGFVATDGDVMLRRNADTQPKPLNLEAPEYDYQRKKE